MRSILLAIRRPMVAMAAVLLAGADGPPSDSNSKPTQAAQAPARVRATDVLEKAWPAHPEWAAMLVDILQGSQLGPGEGWFKKGVSKTRFTWDATRRRLDKDGDEAIVRDEFAGPDLDFARLDRDRDGSLTEADFDFSAHALSPSPGAMLYYLADRDGDGRVTPDEFQAVFKMLDLERSGFLSQDDLRRVFAAPTARPRASQARSTGPSRLVLLKGLFRQEIGSLRPGPDPGDSAPDFTLKTVDGREDIQLSKLIGPRPVVLVFGNFTCGPFRGQAGNVEKLYQRYKDRATFLMIYVREAHPTDGWQMDSNERVGVSIRQPRSFDERAGVAKTCQRTLDFGFPMVVDTIDDAVGAPYSGMPGRLYLIDRKGLIAYKSGRGPFGFKPAELEQSLLLLLEQDRREEAGPAPAPKPKP